MLKRSRLIWRTSKTYEDLAELENLMTQAHKTHFENHFHAYQHLEEAQALIGKNLERRKIIFNELVTT